MNDPSTPAALRLTDTHAHLDFPDYAADLDAVLSRARQAGVRRILTVGIGLESIRKALDLATRCDGVRAAVGVHPTEPEEQRAAGMEATAANARDPRVLAIGETGLDYYHVPPGDPPGWKERQRELFVRQMEIARDCGKPVVVHCREAHADVLPILSEFGRWRECPGVLHCFAGDPDIAEKVYALGYMISVGGVLTFKNAAMLREVVKRAPRDRLLLETDCPFLAPVPQRGKRNEPALVRLVAEKVAELWEMPLEDTCTQIESNVDRIFGAWKADEHGAPPR